MRNLKHYVYIFLICLLAFFLRIYNLDKIPNSISADEAAFGYNSYSILRTGRDEFGLKYPLYLRSFDDYKNPLFAYALIPFIRVFGLNEWSIRLPSALLGTFTIPVFFGLSWILISKKRVAYYAAFLASISPWLIQYSRVAIDTEIGLFLAVLGVWLFLLARNKRVLYLLTAMVFGLAFYSYHADKFWIILFGILILFINKVKINKYLIGGFLIFILMLYPYISLLTNFDVNLRPYAVSVFSNIENINTELKLANFDINQNIIGANLIHNRRIVYFNEAVSGFLRVLNPEIYFSQNSYNQISITRLFYLWEIPLILIGVLISLKKRYLYLFLFSWLVIGFIPGGLTYFPPLDRRIFINSFPFILFSALGLNYIGCQYNIGLNKLINIFLVIIIMISFYIYLHNYFIHGQTLVTNVWGNGMKQLFFETLRETNKYRKVIVSIKLNQPLTFFLFYDKYTPEKYLADGGTISGGYLDERNKFDKYQFRIIRIHNLNLDYLYVWKDSENQPCLKSLKTIYMTDGTLLAHVGVYDPKLKECNIK